MRRPAALSLMLIVGLAGCGSSSYSTSPITPTNLVTNGTFTATVSGTAWGRVGESRGEPSDGEFSFAIRRLDDLRLFDRSAQRDGADHCLTGQRREQRVAGDRQWARPGRLEHWPARRYRQLYHHGDHRESHHRHIFVRCTARRGYADEHHAPCHERGFRSELLAVRTAATVASPRDIQPGGRRDPRRSDRS